MSNPELRSTRADVLLLTGELKELQARVLLLEEMLIQAPSSDTATTSGYCLPNTGTVMANSFDLSEFQTEILDNSLLASLYEFDEEHPTLTSIHDLKPLTAGYIHSTEFYIYAGGVRDSCWLQFHLIPSVLGLAYQSGLYVPPELGTTASHQAMRKSATFLQVLPSKRIESEHNGAPEYAQTIVALASGHPNIHIVVFEWNPLHFRSVESRNLLREEVFETEAERQRECQKLIRFLLAKYEEVVGAPCIHQTCADFDRDEIAMRSKHTFAGLKAPIDVSDRLQWGIELLEMWPDLKTDTAELMVIGYWYPLKHLVPEQYRDKLDFAIGFAIVLYNSLKLRKESLSPHEGDVLIFLSHIFASRTRRSE